MESAQRSRYVSGCSFLPHLCSGDGGLCCRDITLFYIFSTTIRRFTSDLIALLPLLTFDIKVFITFLKLLAVKLEMETNSIQCNMSKQNLDDSCWIVKSYTNFPIGDNDYKCLGLNCLPRHLFDCWENFKSKCQNTLHIFYVKILTDFCNFSKLFWDWKTEGFWLLERIILFSILWSLDNVLWAVYGVYANLMIFWKRD